MKLYVCSLWLLPLTLELVVTTTHAQVATMPQHRTKKSKTVVSAKVNTTVAKPVAALAIKKTSAASPVPAAGDKLEQSRKINQPLSMKRGNPLNRAAAEAMKRQSMPVQVKVIAAQRFFDAGNFFQAELLARQGIALTNQIYGTGNDTLFGGTCLQTIGQIRIE